MTALHAMQTLVDRGLQETDGRNRSPEIDTMNTFVGNPMGAPYCAAAVSYAFYLAAKSGEKGWRFPFSGGSLALFRSFDKLGMSSRDPQILRKWRGALGGWTEADGRHGHIFFIKGRLTDASGKVVALQTLEANTSAQGHIREGDGFQERLRPVEEVEWYLDTSRMRGGAWWP